MLPCGSVMPRPGVLEADAPVDNDGVGEFEDVPDGVPAGVPVMVCDAEAPFDTDDVAVGGVTQDVRTTNPAGPLAPLTVDWPVAT